MEKGESDENKSLSRAGSRVEARRSLLLVKPRKRTPAERLGPALHLVRAVRGGTASGRGPRCFHGTVQCGSPSPEGVQRRCTAPHLRASLIKTPGSLHAPQSVSAAAAMAVVAAVFIVVSVKAEPPLKTQLHTGCTVRWQWRSRLSAMLGLASRAARRHRMAKVAAKRAATPLFCCTFFDSWLPPPSRSSRCRSWAIQCGAARTASWEVSRRARRVAGSGASPSAGPTVPRCARRAPCT
jgi:hypothetical protein